MVPTVGTELPAFKRAEIQLASAGLVQGRDLLKCRKEGDTLKIFPHSILKYQLKRDRYREIQLVDEEALLAA